MLHFAAEKQHYKAHGITEQYQGKSLFIETPLNRIWWLVLSYISCMNL